MTAKRFWFVPLNYHGECRFVRDNNQLGEKSMSNQEVVDTLNKFQELSINDLKQIEQLKNENEQLKERNQRQSKRLGELYELMAKKDWESLTEIIDDFCSCEEQLQQEWKCYE